MCSGPLHWEEEEAEEEDPDMLKGFQLQEGMNHHTVAWSDPSFQNSLFLPDPSLLDPERRAVLPGWRGAPVRLN